MNPFGPFARDEFLALVTAPFGAALDAIRRHDPLYGRKEGEKIRWKVTLRRQIPEIGTATVVAASLKEAEQLADNLTEAEIDWDVAAWADEDGVVEHVEPEGPAPGGKSQAPLLNLAPTTSVS